MAQNLAKVSGVFAEKNKNHIRQLYYSIIESITDLHPYIENLTDEQALYVSEPITTVSLELDKIKKIYQSSSYSINASDNPAEYSQKFLSWLKKDISES